MYKKGAVTAALRRNTRRSAPGHDATKEHLAGTLEFARLHTATAIKQPTTTYWETWDRFHSNLGLATSCFISNTIIKPGQEELDEQDFTNLLTDLHTCVESGHTHVLITASRKMIKRLQNSLIIGDFQLTDEPTEPTGDGEPAMYFPELRIAIVGSAVTLFETIDGEAMYSAQAISLLADATGWLFDDFDQDDDVPGLKTFVTTT